MTDLKENNKPIPKILHVKTLQNLCKMRSLALKVRSCILTNSFVSFKHIFVFQ